MKHISFIISLMGPTASGKTECAIELFQKLSCELVSVDSAMVYRDMNIGTAKPKPEELKKAPHALIDICDPCDSYSVGQFCDDAESEIQTIQQSDRIPLLVGGTMLYFNALQRGIAELPQADPLVREQLNKEAEDVGWSALHAKLQAIDPKAASQIHPHDTQRIQRALEVYLSTGETLSNLQKKHESQPSRHHFINVILAPEERSILRQRIAKRFEVMLKAGFLDEVKMLYDRGDLNPTLPSMRSVGYRQAWSYLSGECNFETMKERAIIATCQLAKRQLTWLRRWPEAQRFNSEAPNVRHQLLEFLQKEIEVLQQ